LPEKLEQDIKELKLPPKCIPTCFHTIKFSAVGGENKKRKETKRGKPSFLVRWYTT
jgi:hypothetical protein